MITEVQVSGVIIDRLLRQCCFVWSEIVGPHSSGNFNDIPDCKISLASFVLYFHLKLIRFFIRIRSFFFVSWSLLQKVNLNIVSRHFGSCVSSLSPK